MTNQLPQVRDVLSSRHPNPPQASSPYIPTSDCIDKCIREGIQLCLPKSVHKIVTRFCIFGSFRASQEYKTDVFVPPTQDILRETGSHGEIYGMKWHIDNTLDRNEIRFIHDDKTITYFRIVEGQIRQSYPDGKREFLVMYDSIEFTTLAETEKEAAIQALAINTAITLDALPKDNVVLVIGKDLNSYPFLASALIHDVVKRRNMG